MLALTPVPRKNTMALIRAIAADLGPFPYPRPNRSYDTGNFETEPCGNYRERQVGWAPTCHCGHHKGAHSAEARKE